MNASFVKSGGATKALLINGVQLPLLGGER